MSEGKAEVEALAARVRAELAAERITEQRMFGGIAFLLGGNMLCCASRNGLMVRIARDREAEALKRPFAGPCMGTGRPMAGFIMVEPAGIAGDESLAEHRDVYERAVRAPSEAFVATNATELEATLGQPVSSKVFRVHRDVRFSKDKSPYNAHVHIAFTLPPGATERVSPCGFYFGLEPSRLPRRWSPGSIRP